MSRLKLSRTDFENHMLRPVNKDAQKDFVSANNKVATSYQLHELLLLIFVCFCWQHVVIEGEIVTVGQGYKEARSVSL